jgi:hypothetical protein
MHCNSPISIVGQSISRQPLQKAGLFRVRDNWPEANLPPAGPWLNVQQITRSRTWGCLPTPPESDAPNLAKDTFQNL